MPIHARGLWPLRRPLIARIRKHRGFLAMQQDVSLGDVVDISCSANDGVDKSRVGIDPMLAFIPN